ncbi:TIGR04222 domain-containing membrane protein [Streptomyces sp. NBC_01803]|uniref:TIGR04222 domain-containing membrane protein n=1 Tax=Streptomyces sp. NBC_01803 TaxID=2975946 RepID=UPI002DD813DF|nr:TIGR04222 domain-containing membrane protein [Streptomyces sp. NBC_01803]WSA43792.1 TIGR04222 domain-containing membrane protein [Streptomyces sp. NBC_01803]
MIALVDVATCAAVIGLVHLGTVSARARREAAKGHAGVPATVYEVAFLTGGSRRVATTVLCAMWEKRRISVEGDRVRVLLPTADDEVERALLGCFTSWDESLPEIRAALIRSAAVQAIGDRVAARGLLWRPELYRPWRRAAMLSRLLLFVLVPVAAITTEYWAIPVAVVGVFTGMFLSAPRGMVTNAGRSALIGLRRNKPFASHGLAALVAMSGTAAVPDAALRSQLSATVRTGAGTGTGGSSSTTWSAACGASGGGGSGSGSGGGSGGGSSCGGGSGCGGGGSSCGGGGGGGCGGGGGGCGGGGGG